MDVEAAGPEMQTTASEGFDSEAEGKPRSSFYSSGM